MESIPPSHTFLCADNQIVIPEKEDNLQRAIY